MRLGKNLIVFVTLVSLFTLTSCGTDGNDFDPKAEQETLESIWEEITKALVDGDTEKISKYYHEDWTMLSYVSGWEGQLNRTQFLRQFGSEKVSVKDREWQIGRDLAVRTSHQTWKCPGYCPVGEYYATDVFRKADGQWFMVHSVLLHRPF